MSFKKKKIIKQKSAHLYKHQNYKLDGERKKRERVKQVLRILKYLITPTSITMPESLTTSMYSITNVAQCCREGNGQYAVNLSDPQSL